MEVVDNKTRTAFCTLKMPARENDKKFGALVETTLREQLVNLFIVTSINLAARSTEDLSGAELWFPHLNREMRIHRPNHMWRESNAVVIELTADDAHMCRTLGANFMQVSNAIAGQEVC